MKPPNDFDLAILGAGSAAFAAAIKGTELGAKVAMIEQGTVGGTCVNVGCVPSKALLRAAEHYHRSAKSPFAGAQTSVGDNDFPAMVDEKDELVAAMRQTRYEDLIELYGIEIIPGQARFTGPGSLDVEGRPVKAGRFLIATGAAPWAPPIPGLDSVGYITSTTALDLSEVPAELTVVGANAIGLELGQLFLHLGSRVSFIEVLERIAPFEEPEISAELTGHLESLGARVITSATITSARQTGGKRLLEIQVGGESTQIESDQLLVAAGRRARTASLGLIEAGVDTDVRGHVITDHRMVTSNPLIFAAGDVTTLPQFVYVAARSGKVAAEHALRGTGKTMDLTAMPRVTFTTPAIASVGTTEAEARERGDSPLVSILPLEIVPRALVDKETTGLIKLVADSRDRRLLGAHILAENAGDVIQAAVMAIKYRATVDDIADTFHTYLTMAEGLKLAAQGFSKDVTQLSCCAG